MLSTCCSVVPQSCRLPHFGRIHRLLAVVGCANRATWSVWRTVVAPGPSQCPGFPWALLPTLDGGGLTPEARPLACGRPTPDALAVVFQGERQALRLHRAASTDCHRCVEVLPLGGEEEAGVNPRARRSTDPVLSCGGRLSGVVSHNAIRRHHDTRRYGTGDIVWGMIPASSHRRRCPTGAGGGTGRPSGHTTPSP